MPPAGVGAGVRIGAKDSKPSGGSPPVETYYLLIDGGTPGAILLADTSGDKILFDH